MDLAESGTGDQSGNPSKRRRRIMTTAATQAGEREHEDVALVPFARAHLEGALKLSQEMSWPYLLKDWEFEIGRAHV